MAFLGLLGFAALVLTSFLVGIRLLWLAKRTRRLPELLIGGAFVFAGGFPGLLLLFVADHTRNGPDAETGMLAAVSFSLMLGASLLNVFTWRVFRPSGAAGLVLFGCIQAGLLIGHAGGSVTALSGDSAYPTFLWIGVSFRIAAYAWAVAETVREWLAARRRCALGLTEPIVVNRMLLWAIGLGAVLAIWVHEAVSLARGTGPGSYLTIALLGFLCSGSLYLAFFPPARYLRRFAASGDAR